MKKILLSLGIIAIVAVGAIGATRAYFSSSATMSGNTFTAGTMDLKIDQNVTGATQDWVDGFDTTTAGFKNQFTSGQYADFLANSGLNNLYPGMPVKQQIMDIKNVGSVNGVATIKFDVTNQNNSYAANNLTFTVSYDNDGSNSDYVAVDSGTLSAWNGTTHNLGTLNANTVGNVKIVWSVPAGAGNDLQGAWATVGTTFGLTQTQ